MLLNILDCIFAAEIKFFFKIKDGEPWDEIWTRGWNWQPKTMGGLFNSIISTSSPSGDVPLNIIPCSERISFIFIVKFISVPVAFLNGIRRIRIMSICVRIKFTWIWAQTHCAAFFAGFTSMLNIHTSEIKPFFHKINYIIFCFRFKFFGISIFKIGNIPGKFNYSTLHPQANSKNGIFIFTCIFNCCYFPFNSSITKSSRDKYPWQSFKYSRTFSLFTFSEFT